MNKLLTILKHRWLDSSDTRRLIPDDMAQRLAQRVAAGYDLMHRLNLSCLSPRPRHRKNDPEAMAAWVEATPLLSRR